MNSFELKRLLFTLLGIAMFLTAQAQLSFTSPTTLFVMHSSGNHLMMATDYGGQLEAANAANAQQMTIVPDGNGYYYIKDYYGRYNYQKSSYYSTNVGSKNYADESGCKFTITAQTDGTFKILNTTSNYYYLANLYDGKPQFTWRNWTSLGANQFLPWLYQYDATAATGISTVGISTEPATTRKVLSNGRLTIVTPDGRHYTLQGILHE